MPILFIKFLFFLQSSQPGSQTDQVTGGSEQVSDLQKVFSRPHITLFQLCQCSIIVQYYVRLINTSLHTKTRLYSVKAYFHSVWAMGEGWCLPFLFLNFIQLSLSDILFILRTLVMLRKNVACPYFLRRTLQPIKGIVVL